MSELDQLRRDLYTASQTLSDLNLYHAAKWASEALHGLAPEDSSISFLPVEIALEQPADRIKFILAKNYFNCKEYERAAHALKDCTSGNALFLKMYATYISVDKTASEDTGGFMCLGSAHSTLNNSSVGGNPEEINGQSRDIAQGLSGRLATMVSEIDAFHLEGDEKTFNPFLLFLEGMIYNKRKQLYLAQKHLVASVKLFPYNWSCWQELLSTFATYEEAAVFLEKIRERAPELAAGYMFRIFEVVLLQEFGQQSHTFHEKIAPLCEIFPNFVFLKVQQFLVAYHALDYFQAESLFDDILVYDPMRLDDLDTYSNMLYVMEKKSKLAFLAQYTSQIDRFRSETCCVVANYHSMKGEHDKAVMYYKRALRLNSNCLSAWTLMGHEFVELKNSHAAIESYRRAVDINAKDFRAWYGLGQAYEVLDMHLYALYYYQRATALQPADKRMWQATGNCYEKIGKWPEAQVSFEKALAIETAARASEAGSEVPSAEPHTCYKLAIISEKMGDLKDTLRYMRLCFESEYEYGVTDETSKARLWLAKNALEHHHYDDAYELAKDFNFSNAHDVEEARAVAKEARSRMGG